WALLFWASGIACFRAMNRRVAIAPAAAFGFALPIPFILLGAVVGGAMVAAVLYAAAGVLLLAWQLWKNRPFKFPRPNKHWIAPMLLVVLVLLFAAPVLIRPITSYDLLSYHLPLAQELRQGNAGFIEGNYYSRLPLGAFV